MTILQESRDVSIWLCGGHLTLRKSVWGAYKEPSNGILLAMSHLNTTQYLMRMASRYFIFYCALWFHGKCLLLFTLFISLLVESWYSCLLSCGTQSCCVTWKMFLLMVMNSINYVSKKMNSINRWSRIFNYVRRTKSGSSFR